jgi:peptidoglycan/LPS O-acetylase OafA/YrhL
MEQAFGLAAMACAGFCRRKLRNANFSSGFSHYQAGGSMKYAKWLVLVILVFSTASAAFAQQPPARPAPSHKYRTIFTPAGAAGGFAAGLFIGLAKFDDAVNSERKVTTAALIGAAGGGAGGYFLGRALDKHRDRSRGPRVTRNLGVSPLLSADTKAIRVSISF